MRLEFAVVGLLIAACTEPVLPTENPGSDKAAAAAEADSGATQGTERERGGRSKPPTKAQPGDDDNVELDAGADREVQSSEGDMIPDASQVPPGVDAGSAGTAGAGGPAPVATGGTEATAMPTMGDVVGAWSGELEDVVGRKLTACVRVTQVGMEGPAGETFYAGALTCNGRLSYRETADATYSFNEVITSGTGCPPGILKLTVTSNDAATYNWLLNPNSRSVTTGKLARTAACP